MRVAKEVDKQLPRIFIASDLPKGRDKTERAEIEKVINQQNYEMDEREKRFYDDLYYKYGGNMDKMPWHRKGKM